MNVPPSGLPSPTSSAKRLILKPEIEVEALTNAGARVLKEGGWAKRRNV